MATIDAPISALDRGEPQAGEHHDEGLGRNVILVGQILCVLVPVAIWFSPLDLEPQTKHAFAIVSFMVIAWITQAMNYALAGFIGCFLFWALGIVRFLSRSAGFPMTRPGSCLVRCSSEQLRPALACRGGSPSTSCCGSASLIRASCLALSSPIFC